MPSLTVWQYDTPMGAEAGEVRRVRAARIVDAVRDHVREFQQ